MKRVFLYSLLIAGAACRSAVPLTHLPSQPPPTPTPAPESRDDDGTRLRREEWFAKIHSSGEQGIAPDLLAQEQNAWRQWRTETGRQQAESTTSEQWTALGPSNISGRVLSVTFDPSDSDVLYAGTAGGGLYRSLDGGESWNQLGGDKLASLWIGAVAVDPRNPNNILAGTGEMNSNVGGYGGFGGIFKSTDRGATFTQVTVPEYGFFRTLFSRNDSSLVILASGNLWRSTNGGGSFSKVRPGEVTDVVEDPLTSGRFLAVACSAWGDAASTLLESVDGGLTWKSSGSGLPPSAEWGRSALAFSTTGEAYLALGTAIGGSTKSRLFYSNDGGATWVLRATDGTSGYAGVGWYGAHLEVSRFNPRILVQNNGGSILMSRDGGVTWSQSLGEWHADTHGIALSPLDPMRMACATDGGVAVSMDGGYTYTTAPRGLETVQYYSCALASGDATTVYGGTQDNWMSHRASGPEFGFQFPPGLGDVGAISVNSSNTQQLVAVTAGGADIGFSNDGGNSFEGTKKNGIADGDSAPWAPQLARARTSPSLVAYGSLRVNLSHDGGHSWSPIVARPELKEQVTSLAFDVTDANSLWTAWSDGKVFLSRDGGTTWADRTPPSAVQRHGNRLAAGSAAGSAYVALSGSSGSRLFKTADFGNTWTDITSNLPQVNLNVIALDPHNATTLYAGTDSGIATSTDDGAHWTPLDAGFPNAVTLDICTDAAAGRIVAATYGRGMWEWKAPLNPQASFSFRDLEAAGTSVYFHDHSQNATAWHWDFGDGSTSSDRNPRHTFLKSGTYPVSLTVTNAAGASTNTASAHVEERMSRTLRRSAPAQPLPLAGLTLWLKADDGVEVSEGNVYRWSNLAGPGDARQETTSARPQLVPDALNHLPVVHFNGSSSLYLSSTHLLTSQQFTIILIASSTGTGYSEFLSNWNWPNAAATVYFGTAGPTIRFTDAFTNAGNAPGGPAVYSAVSSQDGAAVYVNGFLVSALATPLPNREYTSNWYISRQGAIDGEYINGDIGEIFVYDRALSDSERSRVESYLLSRWLNP